MSFVKSITFCIILYAIAVYSIFIQLFTRRKTIKHFFQLWHSWKLPSSPTYAVITGGSSGIGKQTAVFLCSKGYHVIIGSKNETEGKEALEYIFAVDLSAKAEFVLLDVASKKSVDNFVEQFQRRNVTLHLLINNAAVMMCPFTTTEDGYELHMAVNFLGHVYLTRKMLPYLIQNGTAEHYARIINVSSVAHVLGHSTIKLKDILRSEYSSHEAYSQSKLAVILGTKKLDRILRDKGNFVTCSSVNPGVVDTNLYRHTHPVIQLVKQVTKGLLKTPAEGAYSVIFAAVSPTLEGRGGLYISDCAETSSSSLSCDQTLQDQIWTQACQELGISW